jgi:hypothetical protein
MIAQEYQQQGEHQLRGGGPAGCVRVRFVQPQMASEQAALRGIRHGQHDVSQAIARTLVMQLALEASLLSPGWCAAYDA